MALRCVMVEACADTDAGSIGAFYVMDHARRAGHTVDMARTTRAGYDVELISVHHCDDFLRLAVLPKRAPVRIVGGHPMQNNPRPAIPFADVICVGEGETWIKNALELLESGGVEALRELPGTIICHDWTPGAPIPATNIETPLPDNPPYLNRPGTRSAAWYIEIARGCPYSCAYCELGHSSKFRIYKLPQVKALIDSMDVKQTRKICFYAPDEASYPWMNEAYDYLMEKGYAAGFSSMHLKSIVKNKPKMLSNRLIRIGVDGLTEATRFRVGKKITDDDLVAYFQYGLESGHVQFKNFMIFGYPWETLEDFDGFEHMMRRVMALPMTKNVSLRIKWTPFIPQPCTPLGRETPVYNHAMVDKINVWHALNGRPRHEPGFWIESDGIMTQRSHQRQVDLSGGDEFIAFKYAKKAAPLHKFTQKRMSYGVDLRV